MTIRKLKNLTPHEITLVLPDGGTLVLPVAGPPARVETVSVPVGEVQGVPLMLQRSGPVIDLPAPEPGVMLVVSLMVRTHGAVSWRGDLVSPGDLVRDAQGRVVGAKNLVVSPQ